MCKTKTDRSGCFSGIKYLPIVKYKNVYISIIMFFQSAYLKC